MTQARQNIVLEGLLENNPRDFLASLGLLDWLHAIFAEYYPKLFWCCSSGHPVLHFAYPLPQNWAESVLAGIQEWRQKQPNPFGHGKIEAIEVAELRRILACEGTGERLQRFYCGLSSQLANERSGRRSDLIIESASRSVLSGVNDLISDAKKPLDLEADLLGRGAKREVKNTSRWHPAEYQPAAYVATDPQLNKHRDWVGLNILALFGTAFYPVIDISGGRATAGFRRIERTNEFSWPVWQVPLGIDEIRSLLVHPFCHEKPADQSSIQHLGIHRIWRSRKFKPDGNNDYFSTATPV